MSADSAVGTSTDPPLPTGPHYTPKRVSSMLGIDVNTVYDLLHRGALAGEKYGGRWRVYQSDIDAYRRSVRTSAA